MLCVCSTMPMPDSQEAACLPASLRIHSETPCAGTHHEPHFAVLCGVLRSFAATAPHAALLLLLLQAKAMASLCDPLLHDIGDVEVRSQTVQILSTNMVVLRAPTKLSVMCKQSCARDAFRSMPVMQCARTLTLLRKV